MVKKKSSRQNIIIIILCILLLISVAFGFTYSYYNGKSNLVTGKIITANLSIELSATKNGQTSEYFISAQQNEEHLVCGNPLNNAKLNLLNKSNENTYMVVVCSFVNVIKLDDGKNITSILNNVPALEFQDNAYDSAEWTSILYKCKNVDKSYTCLVYKDVVPSDKTSLSVLKENSVKIPNSWNDDLQNCNITISVVAYAIQSSNLEAEFYSKLELAQNESPEKAADVIASKVLEVCLVDYGA